MLPRAGSGVEPCVPIPLHTMTAMQTQAHRHTHRHRHTDRHRHRQTQTQTEMQCKLTMNGWHVIHQRKAEHRTCKEHSMNMFLKPQHPKIYISGGSKEPEAKGRAEPRSSIRHAGVKFEDGLATAPLPSSPIGRPTMLRQLLTSSWPSSSPNQTNQHSLRQTRQRHQT